MNNPAPGGMEHGAASDISYLTSELTKVWPYEKQMMFTLDKGTLDYIEERRHKTRNQDVIFTFYLTLTVLIPSIRKGEFKPHNIQEDIQVVRSSLGSPEGANENFSILVLTNSENTKNRLFEEKIIDIKRTYTIPSSDWVNDFQERLGLGRFLIVEIPQLAVDVNSIDSASLDSDQKEFKDRLLKAFELWMIFKKI
jgi:hypothetical protein